MTNNTLIMKYFAHFSLLNINLKKMRYRIKLHIIFVNKAISEIPIPKAQALTTSTARQIIDITKMLMSSLS